MENGSAIIIKGSCPRVRGGAFAPDDAKRRTRDSVVVRGWDEMILLDEIR